MANDALTCTVSVSLPSHRMPNAQQYVRYQVHIVATITCLRMLRLETVVYSACLCNTSGGLKRPTYVWHACTKWQVDLHHHALVLDPRLLVLAKTALPQLIPLELTNGTGGGNTRGGTPSTERGPHTSTSSIRRTPVERPTCRPTSNRWPTTVRGSECVTSNRCHAVVRRNSSGEPIQFHPAVTSNTSTEMRGCGCFSGVRAQKMTLREPCCGGTIRQRTSLAPGCGSSTFTITPALPLSAACGERSCTRICGAAPAAACCTASAARTTATCAGELSVSL